MSTFRLAGGGDVLVWQRPMLNDSRVEQISCPTAWFYAQMLPQEGLRMSCPTKRRLLILCGGGPR